VRQSIAQSQPFLILAEPHVHVVASAVYRDVATGFEVVPRLLGSQVRLEVTSKLAFHNGDALQPVTFRELRTTVIVPLGPWIDLGTALGTNDAVTRAIVASGADHAQQRYTVTLKIE